MEWRRDEQLTENKTNGERSWATDGFASSQSEKNISARMCGFLGTAGFHDPGTQPLQEREQGPRSRLVSGRSCSSAALLVSDHQVRPVRPSRPSAAQGEPDTAKLPPLRGKTHVNKWCCEHSTAAAPPQHFMAPGLPAERPAVPSPARGLAEQGMSPSSIGLQTAWWAPPLLLLLCFLSHLKLWASSLLKCGHFCFTPLYHTFPLIPC